jgi:hypothetical protein
MKDRNKSAYEKILLYKDEMMLDGYLNIDGVRSLDEVLEELMDSHTWLKEQMDHVMTYMLNLQNQHIIHSLTDEHGVFDIFKLFLVTDTAIVHREAMLEIIKERKLEKEYKKRLALFLSDLPEN